MSKRTRKNEIEQPYTVELDEPGCEKCGAGRMYRVVDSDGLGSSVSHSDLEDAEDEAAIANAAYELGAKKAAVEARRRK